MYVKYIIICSELSWMTGELRIINVCFCRSRTGCSVATEAQSVGEGGDRKSAAKSN